MIIKIIPETEQEIKNYEKKGISEVEHCGVREFMMFGNKVDSEGDMVDFHEWTGSYRYLMGGLDYFYQTMNDNRRGKTTSPQMNLAKNAPSGMIKRGGAISDLTPIDISNLKGNDEIVEVEKVVCDELPCKDASTIDPTRNPLGLKLI